MTSQDVLELYETVADITTQMLAAARSGDWEQLAELESRCSSHIARLKTGEQAVPLQGTEREHKVRMIKKILDDDRQIRDLTEPWMANLLTLINSSKTERKLSNTYGANRTG